MQLMKYGNLPVLFNITDGLLNPRRFFWIGGPQAGIDELGVSP